MIATLIARDLHRLQFVTETLRALDVLAAAAPDWLAAVAEAEWFDRHSARSEDTRFPSCLPLSAEPRGRRHVRR
ncbi:hypothetical protein OHA40_32095 [Nocardia sp. NBC_00508]|uniref:hypothetical protein n=1 Tax=Nocardia sp. NBC_00508 TaxID=2975992 RepID=UPI002E800E78|nr:hypothetical protein [Nocardia sp. NBC_00508]WUD66153.1 hypothetical protein OHA40_32095 [Nocardia sp. NBC_00508]